MLYILVSLNWMNTSVLVPLAASVFYGGTYFVTVSHEGLAKVREASDDTGHQDFIPTLSSSPHGLVFILNIIWKNLFKCCKHSMV